ncbi:MAG TPA: N-acyl homoserine lactonase family protein [Gammaproteobacteria bacterium]|nr:N-acyl homoserine lactonase family protein [Gammaproteobacteria bacterium]
MARTVIWRALAGFVLAALAAAGNAQNNSANRAAVQSPRIYVLDGGVLASETARYRLTDADVEEVSLSVASYLIVHPRGVLMWDAGAVGDHERIGAMGVEQRLLRRDGQERFVKLAAALVSQLASAGYQPSDVTHLALSHYHWDHTADANLFASATWLVPQVEHDAMFSADPPGGTRPETYSALNNSRTTIISQNEHDVFGDGTVIIKQAHGHTEGHMVLYVKLARTGGVLLSGDLYHYPAERTLGRLPTFEVSEAETKAAREEVERFLSRTGAQLWIQHDLVAHRKLKKAPEYYD